MKKKRYVILEHHPNDSRIRIVDNGICQTLNVRMGTGGGNVPIVVEIDEGKTDNGNREEVWRIPSG